MSANDRVAEITGAMILGYSNIGGSADVALCLIVDLRPTDDEVSAAIASMRAQIGESYKRLPEGIDDENRLWWMEKGMQAEEALNDYIGTLERAQRVLRHFAFSTEPS